MADILAMSTVAGALGALAVTKIRQNLHRQAAAAASWTDDERIHEIRSHFCVSLCHVLVNNLNRE